MLHVMLVARPFFVTTKVLVSAATELTALVVIAFTVRLRTVHAVGAARKNMSGFALEFPLLMGLAYCTPCAVLSTLPDQTKPLVMLPVAPVAPVTPFTPVAPVAP